MIPRESCTMRVVATSVALSYGGARVSGRIAVAGDVVAGSVGVRLW